jgi:ABC-2 type transport system ATP-binding protein
MIHLHHIRKQFGHFTAVDDVTLSIEKGTVYGLLGANGARNRIKQSIGYMSQKFSLYQDLTVSENIAFYARLYGIEKPETRARELSEQFDVYTFKDKVVYSLSSGVRQRVAFACALVHAPKLLFLDEPTSGVDPLARRKVWKWLYRLAADGMSIVVTTHYMDEAEHCDRIALMNAGRIVAEGTLDTLRKGLPVQLHSLEDIFVHVMREDVNR